MRLAARLLSTMLVLLPLAAFGGVSAPRPAADDGVLDDADDGDALTTEHHATHAGCPAGMARVGNDTCMDRFEAPNRAGARPLVMQTARDAETWCDDRHKRLCTEDEWIDACEGADHHEYPYGDEHEDGRCNDDKEWRTVNESILAKWPDDDARRHAAELYQGAPSGSKHGCKTQKGVADLTGNVEEWVTRTRAHAQGWPQILIGCYWSGCYGGGKPTCHSTNGAHGPEFRFYETGFRCCKDPLPGREAGPEAPGTRRRRDDDPER